MDTPGYVVRHIDQFKGQGLFAGRNYNAGDVIFEEIPLVCCQFSWNAAYGYKACDHCMRPLETAEENVRRLTGKEIQLPYPELGSTDKTQHSSCSSCGAPYCSVKCRQLAFEQYHQLLCFNSDHPLSSLIETWKQMHYPPETTGIMLIARIIACVEQAADKEAAVNTIMQFCHKTVNEEEEITHKLLGPQFTDKLELLRTLLSRALPVTSHWLTSAEDFRSLIALVGLNGQGVGTSVFSEWVKKITKLNLPESEKQNLDVLVEQIYDDMDSVVGIFLNNEGSALYALQRYINHSCEPNAAPHFLNSDFTLSMMAVRNIEAGEEICISYLDECILERSRHTRQKILRENYVFTCHCNRCIEQSEEPDQTSEEDSDDTEE